MGTGQVVRAIVAFVWRECGTSLPSEEQPHFYESLHAMVRAAIQRDPDEMWKRQNAMQRLYRVSPN